MHFGFALDSSDIALWNDAHLDLWDTGIPNKHFACLQDVLKTSSRHVLKTSSKYVCKTLHDISSRHVFKPSWRRLQRNSFSFSKTSSKTSSRRLTRCLQDFKMSSNVWWDITYTAQKAAIIALTAKQFKIRECGVILQWRHYAMVSVYNGFPLPDITSNCNGFVAFKKAVCT